MVNRDRFSKRSRSVIQKAFELSAELKHSFVGSEHILWALTGEQGGAASKVLVDVGITSGLIRELIEEYDGVGNAAGNIPQTLTPDTNRIFELSQAQSERMKSGSIEPEHLLLGILQEKLSVGCKVIISLGVEPSRLTNDLVGILPVAERGSAKTVNGKEEQTKALDEYSRDLTKIAAEGKIDPVIGRETAIQRVIQILSRRTKNNPVLIGEPGVGKTAVAEGFAQRVASGDVPENLVGKRVVSLDLARMLSGTKYRGDFEERIKNVIDEVSADESVILFIDELHTLIGAGAAEGAMDAANIIKPALGRGELQVIGATTLEEYRKHVEKDAALERRFQPITIDEPTPEQALQILEGLRPRYEKHHDLNISDDALQAAVTLSSRYIADRFLPDKAIDLIDEAASRVRTSNLTPPEDVRVIITRIEALDAEKKAAVDNQDYESAARLRDQQQLLREQMEAERKRWQNSYTKTVTEEDIATVISMWTGVPVTMLTEDESERLLRLEKTLHSRIVGQSAAVTAVAKAIRRGRVGLKDPKRPVGSFLFLGPTGVGKTELTKALAEALFGDEEAMFRVDMSEYMERHTVSKLIGSPPGYVGFEDGGQLTEKVRRKPYSVLLFDEIEKGHPDVFNILLQIMEDGVLTDSQGRRVDFRNTVVIMTSNIGAKNITDKRIRLGFNHQAPADGTRSVEDIREAVMEELKKAFRPEFLNRIDDTIVFHQLDRDHIREIAREMLSSVGKRIADMGIAFEADDAAVDMLAAKGFDPKYGARPLRRTIQSAIEDEVAEKILDGTFKSGDCVVATVKDDVVTVQLKDHDLNNSKLAAAEAY